VLCAHRMPASNAFTTLAVLGPSGVVVARCLRHQRAARRTRVQADAAPRDSRERVQTSIETLIDPFVSLRPLRDQTGRIVDFVYEDASGVACVANISAGEDLGRMRVLDPVSRSTASTTRRTT
jgi:hypothetical protein